MVRALVVVAGFVVSVVRSGPVFEAVGAGLVVAGVAVLGGVGAALIAGGVCALLKSYELGAP